MPKFTLADLPAPAAPHFTLADLPSTGAAHPFHATLADLPQPPSLMQKIGQQANGVVNNINNLGGGIVHGLTRPIATGENLAGDVLSHVPLLHGAGRALQAVRPLNPPFYHPNSVAGEIGNVGGQLIGPQGELNVASKIGVTKPILQHAIDRFVTNSATGLAYGNPNHPIASAVSGGLGGEIFNAAHHIPTVVANIARASLNHHLSKIAADAAAHVGKLRTPAEVGLLNEQLGDLPVNFGEVINDPAKAKAIYDQANIPFSGKKKEAAKLVGHTHKFANDLLNELSGGTEAANVPHEIANAVKSNSKSIGSKSKALYATRDKIASENNTQVPLQEFTNAANDIQQKTAKTWLKTPETAHAGSIIQDLTGNLPNENPAIDFSNAHFANSELKQNSRNYLNQGNFHGKGMMDKLSKGLETDINNAAEQTPELKAAHEAAQKHFKNEVVPYRDRTIQKITQGKSNLKSLNATLLNSQHAKVLNDLSPVMKNKVLYNELLRKAEPDSNSKIHSTGEKLYSGYKNLSPEVRQRLVSPDLEKKFQKLKALNDISKEANIRYSPPPTGVQVKKSLLNAAEAGAVGLGSHVLGLTHSLPILGAVLGAERKHLKTQFSPEIRRAYANGGMPYKAFKALTGKQQPLKKAAVLAATQAIAGGNNR